MPDPSRRWRREFPVESVDDAAVSRRGFTLALAGVSCAALVGAEAARLAPGSRDAVAWPARRVDGAETLRPGDALGFDYPRVGDPCLLIRLDPSSFVAYSQRCTHLQCPVSFRAEELSLHCPCHEGLFDARNGDVVSGPPRRRLPRVQLERRGQELWAVGLIV